LIYGGGSPIGIEPVSSEIPAEFSISQNYPNPFNPTTNIEFDISTLSNVKIIVYDMLGKQISVLYNDQLTPGRYKVLWNASHMPSGTYIYKITADNYTEIKKMILIK
jgi:hypothetical protein